ncbi:LamG-like jellyroll fold domain-containing protein [Actinoplanes sp. TFC3]|uniref:LamG-like jellyroll fold domain-containing protein n=1 Tax=Actinoplanes sp. TFC3 TaxID=1710355 RepID=UPI001F2CCA1B|nr:LamG-like jellyroll fold domain-containing protein [Actinoplanes sp. TFC3]
MATAVLGAGVAIAHFSQRSDAAPRLHPVDPVPTASGGVLTNRIFEALDNETKVSVAPGPIGLRYTFDGGVDQPITDESGAHELRAQGQNGGTLSLVPQGSGLAVQYPARCTEVPEPECPRAILEGVRDDNLNPGLRPLQYGASILMNHSDLADGANVVQKGFSVGGGSQFKLQVDHEQGHPSCVIVGHSHIYRAEPAIDVADGVWHEVTCARTDDRLALSIDGVEHASVAVPRRLSIANTAPLRVGGKGPGKGNDQFAGQIDNVFLSIL